MGLASICRLSRARRTLSAALTACADSRAGVGSCESNGRERVSLRSPRSRSGEATHARVSPRGLGGACRCRNNRGFGRARAGRAMSTPAGAYRRRARGVDLRHRQAHEHQRQPCYASGPRPHHGHPLCTGLPVASPRAHPSLDSRRFRSERSVHRGIGRSSRSLHRRRRKVEKLRPTLF